MEPQFAAYPLGNDLCWLAEPPVLGRDQRPIWMSGVVIPRPLAGELQGKSVLMTELWIATATHGLAGNVDTLAAEVAWAAGDVYVVRRNEEDGLLLPQFFLTRDGVVEALRRYVASERFTQGRPQVVRRLPSHFSWRSVQ